jgi:2-oxoglutarate ferredoxin oxidoreductase subunit alpha
MMQKIDFVVRFAGEGGQGVVTAAEALAQAACQVGYHAMTYATFPSQIMGGPTWTQSRISTTPVRSNGDELDVLVAFNKEAYDEHHNDVRQGGVILYDSAEFQLEPDPSILGIAFDKLGRSTGNLRAGNMVVLGALEQLMKWPEAYLKDFVTKRFNRGRPGDDEIIRTNIQALGLGRAEAAKGTFDLGELAPPVPPTGEQVLIKGNDALSLGAIHGGVDTFVGYPISPATTILVYMERNLVGPGKFVYQGSSELESINAVFGAGYAGKKAMTSTAGPGLSLMGEAIGLAWMAEIPGVIVDVQRGGPATGLPTKTEQSDLNKALTPAHGDQRIPVLAPGTVEECFYAAVHAFNWAERYQGPVIVLSEMMLAERAQNIPKPDLAKVKVESRQVYRGTNGFKRYESNSLSPMPIPGGPGGYVANASEHDAVGDTTHLPARHIHMTERRFSKLKLLEDGTFEEKNGQARVALLPWGGSKGPAEEAFEIVRAKGLDIAWYYTMFIHPMPPKLIEELKKKDLVIVPELNYQGQLSAILRGLGIKAESITQYTGLPFKVALLVDRITDKTKALKGEKVRA